MYSASVCLSGSYGFEFRQKSRGNAVCSASVCRSCGYRFEFLHTGVVVMQCVARSSADLVVMGSNTQTRMGFLR